ncbi:MAG: ABC transporter substrate-binding protein [Syntrophobacteraceae bacterium]
MLRRLLPLILLIVFPAVAASSTHLSFVLDAPTNREEEARIIASQLAAFGIEADVKVHDPSELKEMARKGLGCAYLTDWGSSYFDPYDLVVPKLTTGARDNYSSYSNLRVDELLAVAASSTDSTKRAEAYREVQETLSLQCPWVFGYLAPRFEAVATSVKDYLPSLDGRINLHDVQLLEGDTLVVALDTDAVSSLDPAAYRGRETETMIRNLFDGLVTRTPEGKVAPELAESVVQVDSTTYVAKLRRGPTFHNGAPVAVEDVVFTFQRVLNPYGIHGSSSPRRDLLGPLERVEAAGPDEVRFVLERSFPLFLQALVHFQIVCKGVMQQSGDGSSPDRPVGAGPFRFVSGSLDTEIVMERFESYYGGSPDLPPVGPARVRRAVFRPMPHEAQRIEALGKGAAHIVQGVSPGNIEAVERVRKARILAIEGTRSCHIELNNAKPPFNDIRVRKALSLAVDWRAVLKQVYHGFGQPLATCFLPSGFGFREDLAPTVPNADAVRRLLESAGYGMKPEMYGNRIDSTTALPAEK